MTAMDVQTIDAFLSQPLWLISATVFVAWGMVALLTHYVIVPLIAGRDGSKLGSFEAEVVALIALAFGLLISFNAVTVWQTGDMARDAVLREVGALEDAVYEIDRLPEPERDQARSAFAAYATYVINVEWPLMSRGGARSERPRPMLALLEHGRGDGRDDLHSALGAATEARMERIRMSLYRMSRARWAVVNLLALLLIVAMGLLHAEHRRGRAVALGFVSIAISVCFVILFAHGRPFIGQNAIQPSELRDLAARVSRTQVTASADHAPAR
jgi:hypothetical protein